MFSLKHFVGSNIFIIFYNGDRELLWNDDSDILYDLLPSWQVSDNRKISFTDKPHQYLLRKSNADLVWLNIKLRILFLFFIIVLMKWNYILIVLHNKVTCW